MADANSGERGSIGRRGNGERERSDIYVTHVCRLPWSVGRLGKTEKSELSISTSTFFSCRLKLS